MEETIIKSKHKKSIIFIVPLLVGIAIVPLAMFSKQFPRTYMSSIKYSNEHPLISAILRNVWWRSNYFLILGLFLIVASLLLYCFMGRCSLTVTNRRVVGKTAFGKSVELPLNQISVIGLGFFNRISVATSSGQIHFWLVDNRQEIHSVLSELIGKVQGEASSLQGTQKSNSSADELKKFKDLLDSGVITQEEFDAKKKQLLGL